MISECPYPLCLSCFEHQKHQIFVPVKRFRHMLGLPAVVPNRSRVPSSNRCRPPPGRRGQFVSDRWLRYRSWGPATLLSKRKALNLGHIWSKFCEENVSTEIWMDHNANLQCVKYEDRNENETGSAEVLPCTEFLVEAQYSKQLTRRRRSSAIRAIRRIPGFVACDPKFLHVIYYVYNMY